MFQENFKLSIDGLEAGDLYESIISMEVELDEDLAAMFRLNLAMVLQPDGTWNFLDDERLRIWSRVGIKAGFGDAGEELILGYITQVMPNFDPDPTQCTLEIWGMDATVLMDREQRLKDWPNRKDSDIAREIFTRYGLKADLENTPIVHKEATDTIMQRETDIRFLRRLAFRNGFECYVEGAAGHFHAPRLSGPAQPVLAAHFGKQTNVRRLTLEVNATMPANVRMVQIDRLTKQVQEVAIDASQKPALGQKVPARLVPPGVPAGLAVVTGAVATGIPEMTALCRELYDRGAWFVTGEGEIAANDYGHVLKVRRTVTLKGIGQSHSGVYYVSHVTHTFNTDGYTQFFKVKRNALMATGKENFSASDSLFQGV